MNDYGVLIVIAALIAVLAVWGTLQRRRMRAYMESALRASYGKASDRHYDAGEYAHVTGYCANHPTDFSIDDITWNDLNMDDIFSLINYTRTSAGEEYLYYLLRNPSLDGSGSYVNENEIAYIMSHEREREAIMLALYDCGRTGKYSIYDYLNNLDRIDGDNATADIILALLYIPALCCFFISVAWGLLALGVVLVLNGLTYFSKKRRIEPYIVCFSYIYRMINCAGYLADTDMGEAFPEERKRLGSLHECFRSFRFLSGIMGHGAGDPLGVILDNLKIFIHMDIIKFFQMRKQVKLHRNEIDEILTIMGTIDATMSVAMFRAYIKNYCIPVLTGTEYEAEGLYHPLLDSPVSNNLTLNKGMILTGSNASGKSTMLRTIAVNAILAQSIHTVMASAYRAPVYRVYTSLALKDDIFKGESYYMTEIKSLKRIMDAAANRDSEILACVDEVLRGTNTVERIAASYAVLTTLSQVKGLILTATHDLELAGMLGDRYDNYHFDEVINDGDIYFPYKLKSGPATSRNAIELLNIVGYDRELTDRAASLAAEYEETGHWPV